MASDWVPVHSFQIMISVPSCSATGRTPRPMEPADGKAWENVEAIDLYCAMVLVGDPLFRPPTSYSVSGYVSTAPALFVWFDTAYQLDSLQT